MEPRGGGRETFRRRHEPLLKVKQEETASRHLFSGGVGDMHMPGRVPCNWWILNLRSEKPLRPMLSDILKLYQIVKHGDAITSVAKKRKGLNGILLRSCSLCGESASSFVTTTHPQVLLIPRDSRALPLDIFTSSSK